MYWQGHTEKAPQVTEPVSPAPLDLTPATKPEPADAHFIPVRYAIDQMDDPNSIPLQQPFGLPSDWQGQGLLASRLESCHYTLRQLRDGWIYIYNKTTQTLDEYQLKGSQFSYFKPTPNENPDSEGRGEEQPSKTYISYPKGSVLSLVFSTHRWTWIKYLEVLSNIKVHLQHMQTIILTDEQPTEHVGPISQLSQVADIEPSEVEDERFSLSCVMTQANDREDIDCDDIEIKPIVSEDSLKSSLPQDEVALIVAINDPIADGQDIAARHTYYASSYKFVEEQYASQWALMQTVMTLCMFGASDEIRFPYSVKKNHQEIEFYADMAKYYQNQRGLEAEIAKSQYMPMSVINSDQHVIRSDSYTEQPQLADAIQKKYQVNPDTFGRFQDWMATDRYRQQIDWQKLLSDMQDIVDQRDGYLPEIQASKQDLHRYCDYLNGFRCEALFDLWSVDTQSLLQSFHTQLAEALTLLVDEKDQAWLKAKFIHPNSFIALYTVGFSHSLYDALIQKKFYPDTQAILKPKEKDKTAWKTFTSLASDWSQATGIYTSMNNFITAPDVQETKILKDIASGFGHLNKLMLAYAEALSKGVTNMGVSAIAQSSALLLSALPKTFNSHQLMWMIASAEKMALNTQFSVAQTFKNQMQDWYLQLKNLEKEITQSKNVIERYNLNRHKGTVSRKAYRNATKKIINLQHEFAVAVNSPPAMLVETQSIANTIKNNLKDFIKGQTDAIKQRISTIGGLGFFAAILNSIALADALITLDKTGLATKDEWQNIGQVTFYTAAAWSGIRTSKAWTPIKGNQVLRKSSLRTLNQLMSRKRLQGTSELELSQAKYFSKWLAITATFGLVASGIEGFRTLDTIDKTEGVEKMLIKAKLGAIALNFVAFGIQTIGSTFGIFTISFMTGAFITGAFFFTTVALLFIGFILQAIKKDEYQKWLFYSPWGYSKKHLRWSNANVELSDIQNQDTAEKALQRLEKIIFQPSITQKPIELIEPYYHYTRKELVELEVTFHIPERYALRGIQISTNLVKNEKSIEEGGWLTNYADRNGKINKPTTDKILSYRITLPIDDTQSILSVKLDYLSGIAPNNGPQNDNIQFSYFLQHVISKKSEYTALSDPEKIEKCRANIQGEPVIICARS
nr:T6SS effector BTH_I2691 family protein [Vibrio sinus]